MQKVYDNQNGEFPPNVPKKLIEVFQREKCNYSATGRTIGVNKGIINTFLRKGEEPKGREIRLKLFLSPKYRPPVPTWVEQGAQALAKLEEKSTTQKRVYARGGKRVS